VVADIDGFKTNLFRDERAFEELVRGELFWSSFPTNNGHTSLPVSSLQANDSHLQHHAIHAPERSRQKCEVCTTQKRNVKLHTLAAQLAAALAALAHAFLEHAPTSITAFSHSIGQHAPRKQKVLWLRRTSTHI
jgi:hypothetical protein